MRAQDHFIASLLQERTKQHGCDEEGALQVKLVQDNPRLSPGRRVLKVGSFDLVTTRLSLPFISGDSTHTTLSLLSPLDSNARWKSHAHACYDYESMKSCGTLRPNGLRAPRRRLSNEEVSLEGEEGGEEQPELGDRIGHNLTGLLAPVLDPMTNSVLQSKVDREGEDSSVYNLVRASSPCSRDDAARTLLAQTA